MKFVISVLQTAGMALLVAGSVRADVHYVDDTAITITPCDEEVLIQFDSTVSPKSSSEFFADHACLDSTVAQVEVHREFCR